MSSLDSDTPGFFTAAPLLDDRLTESLAGGGVWVFDWPIDRLTPKAHGLLTPAEHDRAGRFLREQDRVAFMMARAGVRAGIAELVGAPPRELVFDAGAHGKPRLAGGRGARRLRFNLSHSGGVAMLAVASEIELGVDVEHAAANRRAPTEVASKNFTTAEQERLRGVGGDDLRAAFFTLWTRKEAIIKLTGEGLHADLLAIETPASSDTTAWAALPAKNPLGLERCWLTGLAAPADCVAALACSAQPTEVVRRTLTPTPQ